MRILINGGTRGIGRETAILFSNVKTNELIVTGRSNKALDNLRSEYAGISVFQFDITSSDEEYNRLKGFISRHSDKIDIMINCAGYLKSERFIDINNDEVRKMFETNFFGPARMIRHLQPLMAENSHIVNITSMGGFQGSSKFSGMSYYSASKAALACLSECLALEFAENKISVNALALGAVQTEMLEEAFPGYTAPVTAAGMAEFIVEFATSGHKYFNGKILPVSISTP